MSKLDELIQTLCPDGVEYKAIESICNISRGKVMSKDYIRDNFGEYPVYSSQTENNGVLGTISTYEYDGEYLTWTTDGANAGSVFYRNGKFSVTNVCGLLKVTDNSLLSKYLYYILKISTEPHVNRGMGNAKLMSNVMAKIKVPVPPMEVQGEIVRILDNFTELTAELTAELTVELTARKKQYKYYRDELLTFDENVEYKSIKEVADNYTGLTYKPDNVSQSGTLVLRSSNIKNSRLSFADNVYVSGINIPDRAIAQENDILICVRNGSRALIGKSALIPKTDKPMAFGAFMTVLRAKENVYYKYLYYAWQTTRVQRMAHGDDAMPINQITNREFARITIPVPSMDKQIEIANLLDRFDALCNDISIGLPAEIEARQKQYEYYRDKLLTFKEVS